MGKLKCNNGFITDNYNVDFAIKETKYHDIYVDALFTPNGKNDKYKKSFTVKFFQVSNKNK